MGGDSNSSNYGDIVHAGRSNTYYVSYKGNSGQNYVEKFQISGTGTNASISSGTDYNIGWYNLNGIQLVTTPRTGYNSYWMDEFVIAGHLGSSSTGGYLRSFQTTDSISTLMGPNKFVGFPKQAYSNGQTATIQTFGSVVDGFSGLDPGWQYYLQADGTIGKTMSPSQYYSIGTYDSVNNQWPQDGWGATNQYQNPSYFRFNDAPLAGLAVGTDKLLLTAAVQFGNTTAQWNHQNNHKHAS